LKSDGRLVIAEPIDGDLADADRERQARSHDISMNYVKEDLKKAGYQIIEEQQQYSIGRLGDPLWLIVAQ